MSVPEVEGLQSHCGDPAELRSPSGPGRGLRDTGDSSLGSVAVPDCKAEPVLVCATFRVPRTKEELRIWLHVLRRLIYYFMYLYYIKECCTKIY